jgi:hypothetical protein
MGTACKHSYERQPAVQPGNLIHQRPVCKSRHTVTLSPAVETRAVPHSDGVYGAASP